EPVKAHPGGRADREPVARLGGRELARVVLEAAEVAMRVREARLAREGALVGGSGRGRVGRLDGAAALVPGARGDPATHPAPRTQLRRDRDEVAHTRNATGPL